jgi:hypothetical protein
MYQRAELKSAVAFFFLFFLHGTSIGNGQQGITHNVPSALRLCCIFKPNLST